MLSWSALWAGFKNFWWVFAIAAAAAFGVYLDKRGEARGRADEKLKADLARERQINSQREEAAERVDAFNEAARAVERMPERELRESAQTDPNNRGRVPRN